MGSGFSILQRVIISFLLTWLLLGAVHAQSPVFVNIPSGTYTIGKKGHAVNPLRTIQLDSFRISTTEITNAQFEQFVKATGYLTDAERKNDALVFEPGLRDFDWINDSSANWRYPNGVSRGGIREKMNHPVTCISFSDALAYCQWAGYRLPTLEEWEVASRAGSNHDHFFGTDRGALRHYANIWWGKDHLVADSSDGYLYTSPVASFAPNSWGLYDVYGNVFEFCSGKLASDRNRSVVHSRGGSWWCSAGACNYFNSYDIGRLNTHASFSNQGFRVVLDR